MADGALRALQLTMLEAVRGRAGAAAQLAPHIAGDDRLDAAGRIEIYANMYRLRLADALASAFPRCAQALGDDFADLAADYVAAHPSTHPSLRDAGAALPEFLTGRGIGWLVDVARLDWVRYDLFDARDQPILTLATLQALGAEGIGELPIELVTAHRLVEVEHAIEAAWRALEAHEEPIPPEPSPRTLLVWREGITVYHRRIDGAERAVLRRCAAVHAPPSFGQICEWVADAIGEAQAPQVAGELLYRWTTEQLLVAPPASAAPR